MSVIAAGNRVRILAGEWKGRSLMVIEVDKNGRARVSNPYPFGDDLWFSPNELERLYRNDEADQDDDSIAHTFSAMRKMSQEKRASNREASAAMLIEAGIQFESKNDGAHLIVADKYDFWPGTGLWMERGKTQRSRGVRGLIKRIKLVDHGR